MQIAANSSGHTIFQALGDPSDDAMFKASRRHEDHHADDIVSTFLGIIDAWDLQLDIAAGGGATYHGKTEADAEATLYSAMGGTPEEIADKYADTISDAIKNYHNSVQGGPVTWNSDEAWCDEKCTTSFVKCLNPATE